MEDKYAEETEMLRLLLAIMHEHDLERIKVKLGDATYEIGRREAGPAYAASPPAVPLGSDVQAPPVAGPNVAKVVAPLTGVFYLSSSPDAQPYVELGDRVESGDVLCVLEAMKLFNEIQSDYAGTIVRVVPENGALVSQGDELFWIDSQR